MLFFIHSRLSPPKKTKQRPFFLLENQKKTHVKNKTRDIPPPVVFSGAAAVSCRCVLLFLVQAVKDFDGVQELQIIRLKGGTGRRHGTARGVGETDLGVCFCFFGGAKHMEIPWLVWFKEKRGVLYHGYIHVYTNIYQ